MPLNKNLFDNSVELHLDAEKAAASANKTISALLKNLEKELTGKLEKGVTEWGKSRIIQQLNEASLVIQKYYVDVEGISNTVVEAVGQAAAISTASALSVAVGGQVPIKLIPTKDYLRTLAGKTIVQGAVQREWWASQAKSTVDGFQTAVRQGLVAAETNSQIVKRVKTMMFISTRHANNLVRTSVQSVANKTREKIFEDNDDVISGKEWSAALDRRTCPTCGARDGKRWDTKNNPIGHSIPYTMPPQHFSCRCSMVPVLKTWKELGINMDELPESTRASMEGQVTDKTFEQWLAGKTAKDPGFADEVLGKGKAQLWRNGKITFDQMISGGKELSLEDLRKKYDLSVEDQHKQALQDIITGKAPDAGSFKASAYAKLNKSGKLEGLTAQQQVEAIHSHAEELKAKHATQTKMSGYKKSILAGKEPTPSQKQAFDSLTTEEQQAFLKKVEKAMPQPRTQPRPQPQQPVDEFSNIQMSDLEKIGEQKGSNDGGLYINKKTGEKYYIKFSSDEANARNEVLAGKLYQKAGVENVSKTHLVKLENGKIGIASEYIEGLNVDRAALNSHTVKGVSEGFAADAWLANWDVVGLSYDNLLVKNGIAHRIDAGGSLLFRAQGSLKGSAFGNTVSELKTLRDFNLNSNSARVFENLSRDEIIDGLKKINKISDDDLLSTIKLYSAGTEQEKLALFEKMKARREFMNDEYPEARGVKKEPQKPRLVVSTERRAEDLKKEQVQVEQARVNGYSIATDKGMIEDHNVVFTRMENEQGEEFTRMWLKLTPEGIKAAEQQSFVWQKVGRDYMYKLSNFENSKARLNGRTSTVPTSHHSTYSDGKNGIDAVYFNSQTGTNYTLKGTLQVDIKGSNLEGIVKGFGFIEEIGIDATITTKEVAEELYLDKLMYIRNNGNDKINNLYARLTAITNDSQRLEAKREFLSADVGVDDITKLTEYNPEGIYQAFNHGRRRAYRPDFNEDDFRELDRDYLLYNNPCDLSKKGGGITDDDMLGSITAVVNGGGQISSQADRMRRGVVFGQTSLESDFRSGGGNYVFTRIKEKILRETEAGIYWKMQEIKRMDAITYDSDKFGETFPETVRQYRKTTIDQYKSMGKYRGDETIFKDGLSYFDNLDRLVFPTKDGAEKAKQLFKEWGYSKWPDGRELDDVIFYRKR